MFNIKYKVAHHTGGTAKDPYASTQHHKARHVNAWHKSKWSKQYPDFISSLGYWGGYNWFIDSTGKSTQFRAVGEETAAQKGHNLDSISYCLAGNFNINPKTNEPVDVPTAAQMKELKRLMKHPEEEVTIPGTVIKVSTINILPHRLLGNTDCYGTSLKDDWARKLFSDPELSDKINDMQTKLSLLKTLLNLYIKLLDFYRGSKVVTKKIDNSSHYS